MFRQPKPFYSKKGPRAVLLLHAYSGSSNDVRMLSRVLEKNNYSVYAPIFAGHGTAEPQNILAENVTDWQADVQAALTFLKAEGFREVAIFGLSMGGIFAMNQLTQNEAEIIGGGSFCSPLFKTQNQVPENFLIYAQNLYEQNGLSGTSLTDALGKVQSGVRAQLAQIEDLGAKTAQALNQIKVPVFLAQGGQDEMIDAQTVFKSAQALEQTDVTLRWFPTSGHVITVDPIHQQFERAVLAFLAELAWNEE